MTDHKLSDQRKLFIHIGTGKTGTTALQNFFTKNADILKREGISYSNRKNLVAHHQLPQSLCVNKGKSRNFIAHLGNYKDEWRDVLEKFDTDVNLISSEFFWGLCDESHIVKIRKLTSSFDVKIIVYLRRHDGTFQSQYNQSVKGQSAKTHTFGTLFDLIKQKKWFDYFDKVEVWSETFGKENIIVRPYEKAQFYGGNIFADFLHHVFGLELTDEFALPPKDPNARLHRIALEYKRLVNHLPLTSEQKNSTRMPLQKSSSQLYNKGRKDYSVLSPQERLNIIQKYAPVNEAIARQYLGRADGRLFYEPLPESNEDWQPYDVLLEDDARYINEYFAGNWPGIRNVIVSGIVNARDSKDEDVQNAARLLLPGLVKAKSGSLTTKDPIDLLCFSSRFKWQVILHRIYTQLPGKLQRFIMALVKKVRRKGQFE